MLRGGAATADQGRDRALARRPRHRSPGPGLGRGAGKQAALSGRSDHDAEHAPAAGPAQALRSLRVRREARVCAHIRAHRTADAGPLVVQSAIMIR